MSTKNLSRTVIEGGRAGWNDTRTTAGRHVLFDHILKGVEEGWPVHHEGFFVDRHGILRDETRRRKLKER